MEDEKRIKAFIEGVIREHGSFIANLQERACIRRRPVRRPTVRRRPPCSRLGRDSRRSCQASAWTRPRSPNSKTTSRNPAATSRKMSGEATTMSPCSERITRSDSSTSGICIPAPHPRSFSSSSMSLMHVDEIQSGIGPNLLVRNWPPAFQEWSTKAVRDAFFASPLFPRLLNPDAVKETIARGVSNGQLAYVGKTAGGKYHPFNFKRSITALRMSRSPKRCSSSLKRPLRLTARMQRDPERLDASPVFFPSGRCRWSSRSQHRRDQDATASAQGERSAPRNDSAEVGLDMVWRSAIAEMDELLHKGS